MLSKVMSCIEKHSMLKKGDTVTVGLSGGADSVALLIALDMLKNDLGITLRAAHLNHQLRGAEADRDQEFSRALCQKLNIEFVTRNVDVAALSMESGKSIELAAREARYAFFDEFDGLIATAHTATDSAETVLFNLTRGTAAAGLCGIPAKRGNIIRPLLFVTRAETESFCKENGFDFITDSTNLSDEYTRNKIRHGAVKTLREINPSFEAAVTRMSGCIFEDNEYLNKVAASCAGLFEDNEADVSSLLNLPVPILKRLLYFTASDITNNSPDFRDIELMCELLQSGGAVELEKGKFFEVKSGIARFYKEDLIKPRKFATEIVPFNKKTDKINSLLLKNMVDCDKIVGELVLRNRMPSDKIKLNGRRVTKSLKKLFCEADIPLSERYTLPVAADENGVVWVYSFGVAERCAVDSNTKNICEFKVTEV